ncbi:HlyD family type I secretion periplasmic adaptor subunit [Roseobacter sp. YSTF-M11]|uniref:Membrane fusion protein (MFP) family protein n=1 Tax=Roseobacter insulae TaxID=2859783 RepID=A0A9X1FWG9_9RHOB|nr:HlyD family type I secretion periplasmic adaptor subunit [Roseobacter insulae]MBW4708948.1 HlyD family type I secretion periplasmic adaptor subunit [Roseobacter insulae]
MFSRKSPFSDMGIFARKNARETRRQPRIAAMIILTLTGFLAGGIVLATVTIVPELARAEGEIVPSGRAHRIESPGGGVVDSVLVREGQRVLKDQVLATLVSPRLQRDEENTQQAMLSVSEKIDTLSRILDFLDDPEREMQVSDASSGEASDFLFTKLTLHTARQKIADQRVSHLVNVIDRLEAARALMEDRVTQRIAAVERLSDLFKSGNVTRARFEAEQQTLDELRGRLIDTDIQLATTRANYAEAQAVPMENELALKEETLTELVALQQERDALRVQLRALEHQRQDLRVRAPDDGIIQSVSFPRLGEVIEAGVTMFELINTTDRLVAEIRINTDDIGHIKVGDTVTLKLTTYDARRYGELEGEIESVSPTFIVDPVDGRSYFRGVVGLGRDTIGEGAWQRPLRVGMATNAEIVTDKRSLMDYLTKPVQRSLDKAFGER